MGESVRLTAGPLGRVAKEEEKKTALKEDRTMSRFILFQNYYKTE